MLHEISAQQPPSPLVSILFRLFTAMHCGAILLDATKGILRLSESAQMHLGEALSTTQGRLCATDRGCDALFQTMLDQALKYGGRERDWRREALGLKRKGKRPVIARVVAVAGEAHNLLEGAGLAVLLVDPEACPDLSPSLLQQVFGLTKSEARLASQLMCDQCLEEIAAANDVSLGTVRSQIKAVFAKTHTHRQAQLVGLLTCLALISEQEADHGQG